MAKVGRNTPCPCGSGAKYKHCHGSLTPRPVRIPASKREMPAGLAAAVQGMREQIRRRDEWPLIYGATLPSVHTMWQDGTRLVSSGNKIFEIDQDESWHGFLYQLLPTEIGEEWFQAELQKPQDERHILANWFLEVCFLEADASGLFTRYEPSKDTGAALAYRSVAYDVFCLMQANSLSQKRLRRLRHQDQFEGARYELWVAASLARAGFFIEEIDDDDRSEKHGEFHATHAQTGAKYWVEAKRRTRSNVAFEEVRRAGVGVSVNAKLVAKALSKPASHPRLIFIDMNVPPWSGSVAQAPWAPAFNRSLDLLRRQPEFKGRPDLAAFIFVTNHPYHYVSSVTPDPRQHFFTTEFNMENFDPLQLTELFPGLLELMHSITGHFAIPTGFPP